MTSVLHDTVKLSEYAAECSRLNIKIYPPDINSSESDFTIDSGGDGIRYGLLAIKNVGIGFIKNILFERETNGKFKSFSDFLDRMANYEQLNKRQVEAFIKCGVFDGLGVFRSKLLAKYEDIIDSLLNEKKSNIEGQIDLFAFDNESPVSKSKGDVGDAVSYPDIPELGLFEKLSMEKEAAGRFFSGHPLNDYIDSIKKLNSLSISSVLEFFEETPENEDVGDAVLSVPPNHPVASRRSSAEGNRNEKSVTVAGIISDVNIKRTKNGDTMAFLTFEDEYSSIEVVVFPKKYTQFFNEVKTDNIIAVQGNISPGRDENPKILLNNIIKLKKNGDAADARPSAAETPVLYIKVPDTEGILYKKAVNLVEIFSGRTEVKIYNESTKKIYSMKNPGTDLDQVFVNELKNLLGEENVKIKGVKK
jgi:DNA polymerase-3 subunit alpha